MDPEKSFLWDAASSNSNSVSLAPEFRAGLQVGKILLQKLAGSLLEMYAGDILMSLVLTTINWGPPLWE